MNWASYVLVFQRRDLLGGCIVGYLSGSPMFPDPDGLMVQWGRVSVTTLRTTGVVIVVFEVLPHPGP